MSRLCNIGLLGFFAHCQVHQLQHELSKKDELLRIVASATEENESDSCVETPLQPAAAGPAAAALSQLEFLRNRLQDLEEENLVLRSEVRGGGCRHTGKSGDSCQMKTFWAGVPAEERHHHLRGEGAAARERLCEGAP